MNKISPFDVIESGLRAANTKQAVIANNIANMDTPGYRRHDVQFQDLLAKAIDNGRRPHDVEALIVTPLSTPQDASGNDVNLDMEVGELIKNAGAYKTYMKLLGKMYQQMERAIQD